MIVPAADKPAPLLRLFVDGASRGNPGPAAAGVIIADAAGTTLLERGFFLGRTTNNVAEYQALLRGLELAGQFNPQRLEVFADSELVVRQITGQYRVRSPDLAVLFEQVQLALLRFDSWQIRHIPRSENRRADRLAGLAIARKGDVEEAGEDLGPAAPGESAFAGPAVQVKVVCGSDPRVCPATTMVGELFRCDSGTPKGLCVYAASAVLPAAVRMLEEMEATGLPTCGPLTVDCPRPGCNARFELTAQAQED